MFKDSARRRENERGKKILPGNRNEKKVYWNAIKPTKMKKVVIALIVLMTLSVSITSCRKDQPILSDNQDKTMTAPDHETLDPVEPMNATDNSKSINSWVMNASTANDIPTQMFGVDYKYKMSYQHLKQRSGTIYGECSWTSYVIAMSCIIKGNCNYCSYPVSYAKVDEVKNRCSNQFGGLANGSLITSVCWHANTYDYSKITGTTVVKSPSYRFDAIKYMLDHIANYHAPFLVISSMNGIGHYRIVFSIDWKRGGTGSTVYYMDCYYADQGSFYANLKSMDLTIFLNSMLGACSNYNILLLKPTGY